LTVEAASGGKVHDYLVQAHQSDLAFLTERAGAIGFDVLLRDGKLLFRPAGFDAAEAATLTLGDDLLRFGASLSVAGQVSAVEVRGWSPKNKAALVGRAGGGDETAVMSGTASADWVGQAFRGAATDLTGVNPVADQAEIDAVAKARFNTAGLALVTAEGEVLGRTDLRPGAVVKIVGAGARFSGPYYLTAVSHRYRAQGGYVTAFWARRNAL
jgi:phage protein D